MVQLDPEFTIAYYNRAEAWLRLKEWEKARADLMIAKDKKFDIIAAFCYDYENVADFEEENRIQLPTDIAALLTPNSSETSDPEVYIARGIDHGKKGRYDLAIADFRRAIVLNPEVVSAYYNRGVAYHYEGRFYRAIDDFSTVILSLIHI